MTNTLLPEPEIQKAFSKYELFVHDVLQPKLKATLEEREKLRARLSECQDLESQIQFFRESGQTSAKTQIDLGSNFYVQAKIPDTSRIYVNVGYGFFAELTLAEALLFLERKKPLLQKSMDHLCNEASKVKMEIQLVHDLLAQLLQLSKPDSP